MLLCPDLISAANAACDKPRAIQAAFNLVRSVPSSFVIITNACVINSSVFKNTGALSAKRTHAAATRLVVVFAFLCNYCSTKERVHGGQCVTIVTVSWEEQKAPRFPIKQPLSRPRINLGKTYSKGLVSRNSARKTTLRLLMRSQSVYGYDAPDSI